MKTSSLTLLLLCSCSLDKPVFTCQVALYVYIAMSLSTKEHCPLLSNFHPEKGGFTPLKTWFYILFSPSGCFQYINKYIGLSPGFTIRLSSNCDFIVFFFLIFLLFLKIHDVLLGLHIQLHTMCSHRSTCKGTKIPSQNKVAGISVAHGMAWQQELEVCCSVVLTVRKQEQVAFSFI